MHSPFVRPVAGLFALSLLAAACGDTSDSADTTVAASPATTEAPGEMTDEMSDEMTDDMADAGTIVDVAVEAGTFTTLVAAVEAAGLVDTLSGDGPFTVLAPTDDAFAAALEALDMTADELLADTDLLTSVLTYHVIPDEVPSSTVVTLDGESVATVNGADITISVDGDTVMINEATVTAVDVEASNGVIHVIDSVLLPPTDADVVNEDEEAAPSDAGTIVDVAVEAGTFTTLVAAVEAAGLVDTLSGDGPFTVLAPTDDAFAAALEALDMTADELLADTDLLTSVLTYHVIPDEVPSSTVVTLDGESVATVNGADITISVDGDTVMINEATVTAVDVEASNGVIHVIDSVLLPPSS
jgi:uncharacterized surface protein with fasciclin (FAS1) repeats